MMSGELRKSGEEREIEVGKVCGSGWVVQDAAGAFFVGVMHTG